MIIVLIKKICALAFGVATVTSTGVLISYLSNKTEDTNSKLNLDKSENLVYSWRPVNPADLSNNSHLKKHLPPWEPGQDEKITKKVGNAKVFWNNFRRDGRSESKGSFIT